MSAILALQEAINIKLRRTYTQTEIADVLAALRAAGYVVVPVEATAAYVELALLRAQQRVLGDPRKSSLVPTQPPMEGQSCRAAILASEEETP